MRQFSEFSLFRRRQECGGCLANIVSLFCLITSLCFLLLSKDCWEKKSGCFYKESTKIFLLQILSPFLWREGCVFVSLFFSPFCVTTEYHNQCLHHPHPNYCASISFDTRMYWIIIKYVLLHYGRPTCFPESDWISAEGMHVHTVSLNSGLFHQQRI